MQSRIVNKPSFFIIGIETRTSNRDEMTGNGKIGSQWQKFVSENTLSKIPHRSGDTVLATYTDYESDVNGEYSFIIGTEVTSFSQIPEGMVGREIPAAKYAIFTSERGPIPGIIFGVWKAIYDFKEAARAYQADFEVYGKQSSDPQNAQIEVYLSIH
jgi:predicted transcriptional regulator YdeE